MKYDERRRICTCVTSLTHINIFTVSLANHSYNKSDVNVAIRSDANQKIADTMTEYHQTRPTDEIEPMIPMISDEETQSIPTPTRDGGRYERPPETDYATSYTRDVESILPGVAEF